MLNEAGLTMSDCFITSVIRERPYKGKWETICGKKKEVVAEAKEWGWQDYPLPYIQSGKYLKPPWCLELHRLKEELEEANPNLIIALGLVANWALCAVSGIEKYRGTIMQSSLVPGKKVLPTYHPGAVQADWSKRVIVSQDLLKAFREQETPRFNRPPRKIYIAETLDDLAEISKILLRANYLALDIETNDNRFISCISFCPNPAESYVIPFISYDGRYHSWYWKEDADDFAAWQVVKDVCEAPIPKLGQNGLYDIQYLWAYGIGVRRYTDDLMLSHHSLYPELPKGLDFMGSIYTNEIAWKQLRPKGKQATSMKRDD